MTASTKSLGSRAVIPLLLALSIVPIAAATVLHLTGWRPKELGNSGELIEPPRPIKCGPLRIGVGAGAERLALEGKWSLVYFAPVPCSDACRSSLYKMRQVHVAQGRDQARIQRLIVVQGRDGLDSLKPLLEKVSGTVVVSGTAPAVRDFARQFTLPERPAESDLDRVFLVDPLGNLIMNYRSGYDANGMLKDVQRLLTYSSAG